MLAFVVAALPIVKVNKNNELLEVSQTPIYTGKTYAIRSRSSGGYLDGRDDDEGSTLVQVIFDDLC